jgi:arylsulfatase A-like enzyme
VNKLPTARQSRAFLARSPLYEEVAHIPLLLYIPGSEPQRIKSLVSLPDIMPTILELAKVKKPRRVEARSVIPLLQGGKNWDFVVTSCPLDFLNEPIETVDADEKKIQAKRPSTVSTNNWSLIYSIEGEPAELYHLPSDPKQQKNLITERADIAESLLNKYVSMLGEARTNSRLVNLRRRL